MPASCPAQSQDRGPGHLPEVTLSCHRPVHPLSACSRADVLGGHQAAEGDVAGQAGLLPPGGLGPGPGLKGGSELEPSPAPRRIDRQEDRLLEPPLSQKLDRQTDGQAMEAALSWHQMSIPEQTGHHEVTPLFPSDTTATRRLSKKVPKTKEPGPLLGAQPLRGDTWAASTLHPQPWELLLTGAMSSERDLAGWPDLQGISPTLVPKPWATSTPLWSSLAPFSAILLDAPLGLPWRGRQGLTCQLVSA